MWIAGYDAWKLSTDDPGGWGQEADAPEPVEDAPVEDAPVEDAPVTDAPGPVEEEEYLWGV